LTARRASRRPKTEAAAPDDDARPVAPAPAPEPSAGSASTELVLAEVLDLGAAAPLLASLLAIRGRDARLDASEVQRVGGQCLQVLLSAAATWRADGVCLSLDTPSTAFAEQLALLGAAQEFAW
jgi:chemotaxis protein CheX